MQAYLAGQEWGRTLHFTKSPGDADADAAHLWGLQPGVANLTPAFLLQIMCTLALFMGALLHCLLLQGCLEARGLPL